MHIRLGVLYLLPKYKNVGLNINLMQFSIYYLMKIYFFFLFSWQKPRNFSTFTILTSQSTKNSCKPNSFTSMWINLRYYNAVFLKGIVVTKYA